MHFPSSWFFWSHHHFCWLGIGMFLREKQVFKSVVNGFFSLFLQILIAWLQSIKNLFRTFVESFDTLWAFFLKNVVATGLWTVVDFALYVFLSKIGSVGPCGSVDLWIRRSSRFQPFNGNNSKRLVPKLCSPLVPLADEVEPQNVQHCKQLGTIEILVLGFFTHCPRTLVLFGTFISSFWLLW